MAKKTAKDKAEELRVWQSTPVYLTPEGLKKLQDKLAHLKRILPGIIEEAQRTAAYGDRSDSVEYADAKARLRRTHGQIFRIEDQLKKIKLISSGPSISGKIQIGSRVVICSKDSQEKTFRIVGSPETDPGSGLISFSSPLGGALLDHGESETVTIETAKGKKEYRIIRILPD